ncbi:alpha-hydroxy acid oxidase [Solicola sp. PLA-1-18]|uniref:alpha-hydroxy acid oxidase n=1 Tax=Solicola sp. PLA-1-18 TaxID=3380532 RepID=UPI003B771134
MSEPQNLRDYEALAAAVLEPGALGYYAGGAGDELTLADNEASWARWALRPRVLRDVSSIDTSVELLGRTHEHPVLVAPMAYQRHAHPDGELAMARAAAATGTTMVLSSQTTTPPAEVAAAVDAPRWFQVYVFTDRSVTDDLVAQAVAGGYEAMVLTVDFPVGGWRERDRRTGFTVDRPVALNPGGGPTSTADLFAAHDPTLTWDDVERLAADSGLPVLVKGVLHPEDARLAVGAGAAGVIVSNHGGRQLDTVLSGSDALGPVVEAVDGAVPVLVDGGIRRGWDVVKAIARGADAVLLGRPALWALAVDGEAGATHALRLLRAELENALALVGCPRVRDLDASYVEPAPWPGAVR